MSRPGDDPSAGAAEAHNAPPSAVRNANRVPRWAWVCLIAILVFDVWLRCHTIGPTVRTSLGVTLWPVCSGETEPLDCDESVYAYAGRRLLRGDVLYRDLTEPKPPGGYWLYTLAVAFGNDPELGVRVLPIPIVLATIGLVWWIALRIRGPGAACLAAGIFAVLSTDPYLYGNGANLEHAINLCSVASLAFLIGGWDRPGRRMLVASGFMLGLGCLFKQVVVLNALVYVVAMWWRGGKMRACAIDALGFGGGMLVAIGSAAIVLSLQGGGKAAYEDVILYASAMARDTPSEPNAPPFLLRWVVGNADPSGTLPPPFGKTDYLVWWGSGSWPLWLVAIPAILRLGLARSATSVQRLVALWTASAWVQVALPGLFWAHYYLLPVPGLAIGVAVIFAEDLRRIRSEAHGRALRAVSCLVVTLALVATGAIQVRDYLLVPAEQLTARYKGGGQWIALRALSRELVQRSKVWDDPHLFVWGWQSPLYVYTGFDAVSRHFFADPLMKAFADRGHPLTTPRTARILRDLRERPPELILAGDPPFPALAAFLRDRYLPSRLVPSAPDGRGLWVERKRYRAFETSAGKPGTPSRPGSY